MIKSLVNLYKTAKAKVESLFDEADSEAWDFAGFIPAIVVGIIVLSTFYICFGLASKETIIKHSPWTNLARDIPTLISGTTQVKVKAISAVAFDADSKTRIFNQNGDEVRSIASLTKLMTAITFLDTKPDWNKEVAIQQSDLQTGAKANVFVGDRIKLKDLFTFALIASDNTAVTALIRSTGISEKDFVALMNKKAKELRLASMQFSDPTGLDVNNRGSAANVSKLAEEAFSHKEITDALKLSTYSFSVSPELTRKVFSTNQLLGRSLPMGAKMLIGKTGHLNEAGYCFTGIFTYKGKMIMTTVLGAPLDENRFSETVKILDWTLRSYLWNNK
ncbi:MAG: serine hydrolase [Candidatus Falkowbacteria bacterium]|nr:serine hydrolase [Candidatus Falkowbacteria bacterium]